MAKRLDEFIGTDKEYVSHLERELLAARQTLNAEESRITREKRTCDPCWMTCAKQLVKQTPMAQSWTSSFKNCGIHDILQSGDAVTCLLDSRLESQLSAQVFTAEAGNLDETDGHTTACLRAYARTTSMRSSDSISQDLVAFRRGRVDTIGNFASRYSRTTGARETKALGLSKKSQADSLMCCEPRCMEYVHEKSRYKTLCLT